MLWYIFKCLSIGGETLYRSASTSSVTAKVGSALPSQGNPSSRLVSDMIVANGSLKRQNHINGRYSSVYSLNNIYNVLANFTDKDLLNHRTFLKYYQLNFQALTFLCMPS